MKFSAFHQLVALLIIALSRNFSNAATTTKEISVESHSLSIEAKKFLAVSLGIVEGISKIAMLELDEKYLFPTQLILSSKPLRDYYLSPEMLLSYLPPSWKENTNKYSRFIIPILKSIDKDFVSKTVLEWIREFQQLRDSMMESLPKIIDEWSNTNNEWLEALVIGDYQYLKAGFFKTFLPNEKFRALLPSEQAVLSFLSDEHRLLAELYIQGNMNELKRKLLPYGKCFYMRELCTFC